MTPPTGEPQQERSRRTLEKLLTATVQVLEQHGLEGATIPRIAERAGVSVGSVYRRFEDKDALFKAAFLALVEQSGAANRKNLTPAVFAGMTLEAITRALIHAMVRQFRMHPGLLKALEDFLEHHPDVVFRERVLGLIAENYGRIAGVLLLCRDRMTHANPERAALFAILTAVTVIQARTLENDSVWEKVAALDDKELELEATDLVVAYLTRPVTQ